MVNKYDEKNLFALANVDVLVKAGFQKTTETLMTILTRIDG